MQLHNSNGRRTIHRRLPLVVVCQSLLHVIRSAKNRPQKNTLKTTVQAPAYLSILAHVTVVEIAR